MVTQPISGPLPARRRILAVAAILVAATCWGTIGTAIVLILNRLNVDGLTVAALRATTATILFWVWMLTTSRSTVRIPRADIPTFLVFGFITVSVFYVALIYAFPRTSVAVGTVVLYMAPALVTLGAIRYLGEPLTAPKLLALGFTFGGCFLVVRAYEPENLSASPIGIALMVIAAICYATYGLMGKRLLARHPPATVLAYHLLFGTVWILLLKLALSPTTWPTPREMLVIGLYTGAVTTVAPITLFTLGLRELPGSEAAILATWEPVIAVLLASTVLGESLAGPQWIGVAAVLLGVALLASDTRPRKLDTHVDTGEPPSTQRLNSSAPGK
jgi:drug/metabolite transporter (DMT)-like permease